MIMAYGFRGFFHARECEWRDRATENEESRRLRFSRLLYLSSLHRPDQRAFIEEKRKISRLQVSSEKVLPFSRGLRGLFLLSRRLSLPPTLQLSP